MLSEEKIKLMTAIAMFEKKEGKKIFPINRYFKSDYVSGRMLRSFFGYTFCYLLAGAVWILYKFEDLLNLVNAEDLVQLGLRFVILYVIGLVAYLIITMKVSSAQYSYASRSMRVYVAKLKRLDKRYEAQRKTKESIKGGGPHDESSRI